MHEIPTPSSHSVKGVFQFVPLFLVLVFQIIYHYPCQKYTISRTKNDSIFEIFLTINLKDKSFHNSVEWSRFDLNSKFKVFRLLENAFIIYEILSHLGMIWSLLLPFKITPKFCPLIKRKNWPHTSRDRTPCRLIFHVFLL